MNVLILHATRISSIHKFKCPSKVRSNWHTKPWWINTRRVTRLAYDLVWHVECRWFKPRARLIKFGICNGSEVQIVYQVHWLNLYPCEFTTCIMPFCCWTQVNLVDYYNENPFSDINFFFIYGWDACKVFN